MYEQVARTVNPCHLLSLQRLLPLLYTALGSLTYGSCLHIQKGEWLLIQVKIHTKDKPSRFQEGLLFLSLYLLHADILLAHIPTKGNLIGREVLHSALLLKELGHLGN